MIKIPMDMRLPVVTEAIEAQFSPEMHPGVRQLIGKLERGVFALDELDHLPWVVRTDPESFGEGAETDRDLRAAIARARAVEELRQQRLKSYRAGARRCA